MKLRITVLYISLIFSLSNKTSAKHVVIFAITQSQVSNSATSDINP